jgi:hypothetical protein
MSRIDLQIPFTEQEAAKRLGACWDPHQQVWFVPAGVDVAPLRKWLAAPLDPNIRAASYFLATATHDCWHCAARTPVIAIVLPAGHEVFYAEDDPADDFWELAQQPTLLSYITDLAAPVALRLRRHTPHYAVDFSQTTQSSYWMNHCAHCASKLGDFATHDTPGAGFTPVTSEQAAEICLEEIVAPFSARCGGYTCGLEWFTDARRPGISDPSLDA